MSRHVRFKNICSASLPICWYFLRPPTWKTHVFKYNLAHTRTTRKMTNFVILAWILKICEKCWKNGFSWWYVYCPIFLSMTDMDLIFHSGKARRSILLNSKHDLRPKLEGALFRKLKLDFFLKKVHFHEKWQKGRFRALFKFWSLGDAKNRKSAPFLIWN